MTEAFKQIPALLYLAVCHLQHSWTASVHLPKCQSMCLSGISQPYCFQIPGTLSRSIHTYSHSRWPNDRKSFIFQESWRFMVIWSTATVGDRIWISKSPSIKASRFTRQPFWQHPLAVFFFLSRQVWLLGSLFPPIKEKKWYFCDRR